MRCARCRCWITGSAYVVIDPAKQELLEKNYCRPCAELLATCDFSQPTAPHSAGDKPCPREPSRGNT